MRYTPSSKIFVRLSRLSGTSATGPSVTSVLLVPEGYKVTPPQETAILWRYLSLAKLVHFLHNRVLWFSRIDLLGDPFEGSTPWPHVDQRTSAHPADTQDIATVYQTMRCWVVVNCWHIASHESEAMWQLYAPSTEGVALKSTVGRLNAQLRLSANKEARNVTPQQPMDLFSGPVSYIDMRHTELIDDHPMARFFLKRLAFSHEREFRVVAALPELLREDGVGDVNDPGYEGIGISVDPVALVEEVVVGPLAAPWFRDVVAATIGAFAPALRVRQSSLDEPPRF